MAGVGYDSRAMVYPELEPRKTIGKSTERKVLSMGQNLSALELTTHNNSLCNLLRGVGERVLYTDSKLTKPIQPVSDVFVRKLGDYRNTIARLVGRQSPVSRQGFAELYKGPRRTLYQRAVDSLTLRSVEQSDAKLKTFVKAEKLNLALKPDPVPRVIQPRDPRYNVELGRYLKPVEHKVYHAIDELFGGPTIFSSYNAFQQARHLRSKWDSFRSPVCVGLDASRFDQHVSEQALEFEHGLYVKLFGRSPNLRRLLRWQIHNKGIARAADGWFKYSKVGGRASGDMNTSMGNKFLMCLMAKGYIDTLPFRVEFVNNGDDCLLIFERQHLAATSGLSSWFKDFGFKLTLEAPVYEFEQIEFCQTQPLCCNGVWRMVRKASTCLLKDTTVVNLGYNIEEYRKRLWHIGSCGLATCADVPVLGSFYRMLQRFGVEAQRYANMNEYDYYYVASREARCDYDVPDAAGRLSFWLQTAITPDDQDALERHFDRSVWAPDKRQLIDVQYDLTTLLLRPVFSHDKQT